MVVPKAARNSTEGERAEETENEDRTTDEKKKRELEEERCEMRKENLIASWIWEAKMSEREGGMEGGAAHAPAPAGVYK